MGKKTTEGKSKFLIVCLVLLLLSPLMYVLSIGPFVWLGHNGHLTLSMTSYLEIIYFPVIWLAENSELADRILKSYLNLFVDMG